MSVLAVISDVDQVRPILSWALTLARTKQASLTVLCWSYSLTVEYPLLADEQVAAQNDALVNATEEFCREMEENGVDGPEAVIVAIRRAIGPDRTTATAAEIRSGRHDLVIAAASPSSQGAEANYGHDPLFRRSPCETIVLYRARELRPGTTRVLIGASGGPHDVAALAIFGNADKSSRLKVTLAQLEDETGAEAMELGRRELKRLVRDAGIKERDGLKRHVFTMDDFGSFLEAAQKSKLVVIGSNAEDVIRQLCLSTTGPVIAAFQRAPPLTRHGLLSSGQWRTRLSPADYADMMQGLRRGAELSSDFLIMLGLAAAIASLGLIQDSPAVVIGSMLLAPLMTPMIACGLAIAQGNKVLGRRSMSAIGVGFLLTLAISFLIGLWTPGNEITQQIIARGSPTILDLLVALASAAAASYALARPNLVGAVAGVAIATALVPPLCSTGISLAYGEVVYAQGAALLFATNLVAIVLGAAVTFRLLGVSVAMVARSQRHWVYRILTVIGVSLILLMFPLLRGLENLIDRGKSKPTTFPITERVDRALAAYLQENAPEVEIVASGRPTALYESADVVLVLSTPNRLARELSDALTEICQREMHDPDLVVEVHCFQEAWQIDTD